MPEKKYVIFGGMQVFGNQPLFWNNDTGWGDLSTATKYTEKDPSIISHIPEYGYGYKITIWVEL